MSSDSEDESMDMFREAVDAEFLNDDMYKQNGDTKPEPETKQLPSLRRNTRDEDECYNFFKVSPDFQKFVSKKLSKLIDEKLQNVLDENVTSEAKRKKIKGGVKLLSTSTTYLKLKKPGCEEPEVVPKKLVIKEDNFPEQNKRCAEVAVKPEDILSGEGVKFWKSNRRSKVFIYKKDEAGVCTHDKVIHDFS